MATKRRLSPLQQRIVHAVLSGATTRTEAQRIVGIKSQWTFDAHRRDIYEFTGARNFADLILWAWRNGWQLPQSGTAGDD